MRLPSWDNITVGQYQDCYFILKSKSTDSWIKVLSTLTGKSVDYFENLPKGELAKCIHKLSYLNTPDINEKPKRFIYLKGKVLKAQLLASGLQTNQVADMKALMIPEKGMTLEDTIVLNLNRLLACVYLQLTIKGFKYNPSRHDNISELMLNAKMGEVYGTLFFYSNLYKELIQAMEDYGKSNLKIVESHLKELKEWQTRKKTSGKGGAGK